jgi:hypothetical protein
MDPRQEDTEIARKILPMARRAKPSDRWPHEPPADDDGPEGGVREPLRPKPNDDQGEAHVRSERT